MPLEQDVQISLNELIDILIEGSNEYDIVGLQDFFDNIYPDKNVEVSDRWPSYLLPNQTEKIRPLEHPCVTIFDQTEIIKSLYRGDIPPSISTDVTAEDYRVYAGDYLVRVDIWGRTPPECRDITEQVEGALIVMKKEFWDAMRVKVQPTACTDAPLDREFIDIYHKFIDLRVSLFKLKEV